MKRRERRFLTHGLWPALGVSWLAACGGDPVSGSLAPPATQSAQFDLPLAATPAVAPARPAFHAAPLALEAPSDIDASGAELSARLPVHVQHVPDLLGQVSTRRLTAALIADALTGRDVSSDDADPTPLGSGTAVATYTPAQIRAAYQLPPLVITGATGVQAAQMGAGQTIYIVDAQDDPNVAAELATFDSTFGLPSCSVTHLAANSTLPLPAPSSSGCTLAIAYSTSAGTLTATAPTYNSGWATEIALDVQWAHATAPLARIVLIESPDAGVTSLLGAVALANSMGPGVVSMSWGSPESGPSAPYDSYFSASNMTYLAAAGDSGAGVQWPAVSSHVLAVGGTSLTYSGSGPRSEVVWSGTGGGLSQFTPAPTFQHAAIPGLGSLTMRAVVDVSFNADPGTGQYLAVMSPGSASASWLSAGGTSLSTPQWAATIAIANALRLQSQQGLIGAAQGSLYQQIGATATNYTAAFADITQGSDGSCSGCQAHAGYDTPTGLGTPNASALLGQLTGGSTANTAPVVPGGALAATTGTPFTYAVNVTAAHPVTYQLSGAPAGMSLSAGGTLSWAAPVAGSYALTITVRDTTNGLSGQGIYHLTVTAPTAPVLTGGPISGSAGTALTYTVTVSDTHPLAWQLTGAPAGLTVSAGVLNWANPTAGSYSVTVTARDTVTNLSGHVVLPITIAAAKPPVVASTSVSAKQGTALSFQVSVSDSNPLTFALTGAPSGMTVSTTGLIAWPQPKSGSYTVTVLATDARTGLTGQGVLKVTVTAAGPVITASTMRGSSSSPITGTISFSDSGASSLSITVTGIPAGMTLSLSGSTITVNWPKPVDGQYTLNVVAKDSQGLSTTLAVPVTVTN